jgi:ATP-dependent Clp protease, protease subunit
MNEFQPFYRFTAEAGEEPASAELLIFDAIGNWDDLGEVSAKAFAKDLSKLPTSIKRLDIHINSPGGSVSEANAIYSRLADHRSDKIIYVDGIAASAATLIAMVGHKIYIRANAQMMIHLPMAIAIGNADVLRQTIAALESHTESMLNLYAKRTGGARDAIRGLMAAETWMSAQVAVEKGFADEVRGVVKAAAMIGDKKAMFNGLVFDLSRFHNVPAFTGQPETKNMTAQTQNETTPAPGVTETAPAPGTEKPKPAPPPDPVPPPPPVAADVRQDAIRAERQRVAALQKYDRPSTHKLVTDAIADGRSVSDITEELFVAMENSGRQSNRHLDASALTGIPPSGVADDPNTGEDFSALLIKKIQARLKRGNLSPLHSRS